MYDSMIDGAIVGVPQYPHAPFYSSSRRSNSDHPTAPGIGVSHHRNMVTASNNSSSAVLSNDGTFSDIAS